MNEIFLYKIKTLNNAPKMSPRSIFLLAATVSLLTFSIFFYILSILRGVQSLYYGNNYMDNLELRQFSDIVWCKELRWRSPPSPNAVALVSYPGSGNTWLRYLLQQATGIVTGSLYNDAILREFGFPGENATDGSVLVVKTHIAPNLVAKKFMSAVLLIRNPRDSILAYFNWRQEGPAHIAPKSAFEKRTRDGYDWRNHVMKELKHWEILHKEWLNIFQGPKYIVYYETLVKDTGNTLRGILKFLNHSVTEDDMRCALLNKEGIYRRNKRHQVFDPFTKEMYIRIHELKKRVLKDIENYKNRTKSANVTKDIFYLLVVSKGLIIIINALDSSII